MSEAIIWTVLCASLWLYLLMAGADFGVGVLEALSQKNKRQQIRHLGEKAIAPIWEANHIWLILALVIIFVAFPTLHQLIMVRLHLPLVLLLLAIILRGTAFSFRYYDLDRDPTTTRLWTLLFRLGSIMAPVFLGILWASVARLRPEAPKHVWDSYFQSWLHLPSLAAGLLALCLFAWTASVFLRAQFSSTEADCESSQALRVLCRRWSVMACAAAALWLVLSWTHFREGHLLLVAAMLGFSIAVLAANWAQPAWLLRGLAGAANLACLAAVAGLYGQAQELPLAISAPESTRNALAINLVIAGVLVAPALVLLFRLFSGSDDSRQSRSKLG